jgi:hypothetical protein
LVALEGAAAGPSLQETELAEEPRQVVVAPLLADAAVLVEPACSQMD